MKIQVFSDLHIEFEDFEVTQDQADLLVFAGDIEVGIKGVRWIQSLATDKPIVYVFGNHEYYGHTYPKLISKAKDLINGSNIHLLENGSVEIDGVHFHGCTLWTDFALFGDPRSAGAECQQVMNDFKKIRKLPNYSKVRSIDLSIIHKASLRWLAASLQNSNGPNVVVTHHAPSIQSIPEQYRNNTNAAAYASNLEGFIEENKPSLWLHGHLHNSSDYLMAGCRIVCNPRGYSGEFNKEFEPEKIIEVV